MIEFNFYRHCWLTLKRSKPRLRKYMDEIECEVEGAGIVVDKSKQKKESPKLHERLDDADNTEEKVIV